MSDNFNVLDNSVKGALLLADGTVTITDNATTTVPFSKEAFDLNEWHDNVTNNTRLTVPNSVGFVQFVAQIGFTVAAFGPVSLEISKSGSTAYDGVSTFSAEDPSVSVFQIKSPLLQVEPGDFFEFDVTLGVFGSNRTADTALTWFSVQAF